MSEATDLTTAPQPLPELIVLLTKNCIISLSAAIACWSCLFVIGFNCHIGYAVNSESGHYDNSEAANSGRDGRENQEDAAEK